MEDITNIQDDNLGGLQLIRFAPIEFFATAAAGTFKPGFDWIKVECTKETMQFNERTGDDVNGGYVDITISGSIPKMRPEISAILAKYNRRPVIVETQDNNGFDRRSGLSGRVILLDQASTGSDVSDLNNYQLQFTGRQLKPSLFIIVSTEPVTVPR